MWKWKVERVEKPHRRLEVWQKSIEFATEIYGVTSGFPADERFGLISQMRRAAVSIPSNLSEGAARGTVEFAQFIRIAIGSTSELDTQLEICHRLSYLSSDRYTALDTKLATIDRMLIGLRKVLLQKQKTLPHPSHLTPLTSPLSPHLHAHRLGTRLLLPSTSG
ncbi:four helix bundle protein [Stenomitos frigidus]|uniref:Four helix bundle protein n=1 Tax=Stenomitos frigidus ULC18 TaxID=2107698 RepID=A0A2T1DV41_9CYAN|nr:four helix bundle protein [Stenomitos frigidus]PSB24349.1 four helix bundle protein [Stenomitos frigidus ULC18]